LGGRLASAIVAGKTHVMGRYRYEFGIGLILAAATIVAYSPVWRNDFINVDDPEYVSENRQVQAGWTAESVRWAWTTFHAGYWQPVTWMSLQLDAQLFGLSPRAFHLDNLVWHIANVLLLFALLLRLTGVLWRSAAAAMLFALHPMHVESVAWITERKDVLSAFFGLLSLWCYAGYARQPGWGRYLLVAITLALGLMAKPMLVTWPCVMLLMDYWPLRRGPATDQAETKVKMEHPRAKWPWLVAEKVPLFVLVAVFSILTIQAQGQVLVSLNRLPISARAGNAAFSYIWYAAKSLWPIDLLPFYPLPSPTPVRSQVVAAAVLLAGITAALAVLARRRPYLLVGWLWFLGTLTPVIGLMQAGEQGRADRFVYLPHIGLFILLVWGFADLVTGMRIPEPATGVAAAAAFLTLGVLTYLQVGYWRDSLTLWEYAIRTSPENSMAHSNLGAELLKQGKPAKALPHLREAVRLDPNNWQGQFNLGVALERQGLFEAAATHYAAAVKLKPNFAFAHANWGAALVAQKKEKDAFVHLTEALRLDPRLAPAEFNWGVGLMQLGKTDDAIRHFEAALNLDPSLAASHLNLGRLLAEQGRLDESARHFRDAARISPGEAPFLGLGRILARQEKWKDASAAFRQALQSEPFSPEAQCALAWTLFHRGQTEAARSCYREATRINPRWQQQAARRAWILCTHPDARERDVHLAIELAEQVCQASEYRDARSIDVLACAQANAGHFEQAVSLGRQAVGLAAASKDSELAAAIETRVRLYEQRRPFRDKPPPNP
jgi:tetratricopeptide (TPR) repeat protein